MNIKQVIILNMKILDIIEVAIAPIILMIYGWYLGQLHVSMQDLAGIIMFITGLIGLILGLIGYYFLKSKKWYWNILLGIAGILIVFVGVIIYARIHG